MSFKSTLFAASALLASANAHMIMQNPVPYSVDKVDSGPITASQYPCKSNLGFTVSKMNTMAVGQKQTLSFKGSAVHGGGSCQLSVTMDTEPNAQSVFKVIKSIEGGCPGIDSAKTFDFELPASIPNGKATFAWTWFAKLSGGPEMYMNCAPIEVTGGASDKSAFNALPDMLVANIASTTCKSPTSKSIKFPNPGANLEMGNDGSDVVDGTGDCGASGTTPAQPSSPGGGQPSSPSSPAAPPAGQPSPPASQPSSPAAPSSAPVMSNPGGVFAPGASSAPGAPAQTSTTLVTVTAVPTPAQPSAPASPGTGAPAVPAQPSAAPAPGYGSPGSGSPSGGASGTCTQNGAVVCNGEKQFGLCNNGKVVWQDVAAGTACANGVISKRSFNGRIARPRYAAAGY